MGYTKKKYGHIAVITGASSGIGMEFAWTFARKGYDLILCARREERLEKLKKNLETGCHISCEIVKADLAQEQECYQFYEEHLAKKRIDVFVNNAGFGDCGEFDITDLSKETKMIDVNIRAVHIFTKLLLRKFKEQNRGYLLNVASSAGLFPGGPYMAAYYASKSYIVSLTRAVAWELSEEGSKVYVGALCPGPVNTEFNEVANVTFALSGISPARCVRAAFSGMKKRKVIIVPSITMKLCTAGSRLLPNRLLLPILAHQQKRKLVK